MNADNISFSLSTFYISVGVITMVVTTAIALSTTYLRMFIGGKMADMQKEIMLTIEAKFPQKEVIAIQLSEHERRIARIETRMETARILKEEERP